MLVNAVIEPGTSPAIAYEEAVAEIDRLVSLLEQPTEAVPLTIPDQVEEVPFTSNQAPEAFHANVHKAKEYITAGDIIQVVLSQRFQRPTAAHPFDVYRALRAINPSPYLLYLQFGETSIVGSSPELLVNIEEGVVEVHPIAGTRRRGEDALEDARLAEELIHDPKEIAEHVMLLDLGRNDVGRVAATGSVEVTQRLDLEYYSHVMHIVSHVQGKLREGMSAYDALRSSFPAGTVSGAPKIRAMEIIDELETLRRGIYAGAVGYFSANGSMDTCIALRTAVVKDGVILGRGWTQPGGRPHAETEALKRAGRAARGATLYVTLEPCSHHGKTPPCVDAIVRAGIVRVVSALDDPNPEVAGNGYAHLRERAITVDTSICEAEAARAHAGHVQRMRDGRPHATTGTSAAPRALHATRRA